MTDSDQITAEQQLTPKQEALITALCSGLNITAAAQASGVSDKTARRWLKLSHFQTAYRDAQHALFDERLSLLMSGVEDALSTLSTLMKDSETPAAARIRAAQIWLDQAIATHKMSELESKVSELERLVSEQQGKG